MRCKLHAVLAPAAGVVIDLHKGEPDNKPGSASRGNKANYIEIDHGSGEISRAVHLQKGSIKVSLGDSVVSGQIIASVGNSGNSDNPHLHIGFHRNIPENKRGIGQIPIPILFSNYRVSWNQGIDLLWVASEPLHGGAHRSQVNYAGDAGEVLQNDSPGHEGDFLLT